MASPGRPRRTTHDMIVDAGIVIGLPSLTVRGIADAIGVSEMTIYRHTGGLSGLQRLVVEGIIARQTAIVPRGDDPEDALVELAVELRGFLIAHPGVAAYLADLDEESRLALTRIDASQRAFAEHFGWPSGLAGSLVSVVAEYAAALAELGRTPDDGRPARGRIPEEAGAAEPRASAERFEWSVRATVRGAMSLFGLAARTDATAASVPGDDRNRSGNPPMPEHRRSRTTPPHTIRSWMLPRAASRTIETLRTELAATGADRGGIAGRFRARLADEGTPIIEPDDDPGWSRITFVRMGPAPHGVVLQLNRISDPLDIEDTLMERVGDSEVHALTLRLPNDWQGGYLFVALPEPVSPTLHTGADLRTVSALARNAETDPYARHRMPSKSVAASGARSLPEYAVARGPEAPTSALWLDPPPPVIALPSLPSPINGASLPFHRWSTTGAGDDAAVVLLLDGEVWREQFPIATELERRAASGAIRGAHLLFLDSGGPLQRELDYAAKPEATAALLDAARRAAGAAVPGERWIVAGQSLGGLLAMLAAMRHPTHVRAAVAQSPSLWWPSAPSVWDSAPGWFEEQAALPEAGAPVLIESGVLDGGVIERTRAAAALLRTRGALIDYREYRAGHDILQWQSTLADALVRAIEATA